MSESRKIAELEDRVRALEEMNDFKAFTLLVAGLPKAKLPSLYTWVEQGVANYFGINRSTFYHRLVVGNSYGRKGRVLPENPIEFSDGEDRIAVARFCLYAILHIDFSISIPDLSDFYNVNAKNYIREWKRRYIRVFHEENGVSGPVDTAYHTYYQGCHAAIVAECHRESLFDELIQNLVRIGLNDKTDYFYLKKWRLDEFIP